MALALCSPISAFRIDCSWPSARLPYRGAEKSKLLCPQRIPPDLAAVMNSEIWSACAKRLWISWALDTSALQLVCFGLHSFL
jgi:hypothetical protein